jgi:hypothetical protein
MPGSASVSSQAHGGLERMEALGFVSKNDRLEKRIENGKPKAQMVL